MIAVSVKGRVCLDCVRLSGVCWRFCKINWHQANNIHPRPEKFRGEDGVCWLLHREGLGMIKTSVSKTDPSFHKVV